MNKKLLFTLLFAICAIVMNKSAYATIYVVQVGPNNTKTFSPDSINCYVGDTIQWMTASGSHTTTSTTIPAAASPWSIAISSASPEFSYVATTVGCYYYKSTNFGDTLMKGVFCVTPAPPASVGSIANEPISIIPNPASSLVKLHVTTANTTVSMYNLIGSAVTNMHITNTTATDMYL
ncbi:MAG: hypothetical protein WCG87_12860, partial [Bacteroidota bacterium]